MNVRPCSLTTRQMAADNQWSAGFRLRTADMHHLFLMQPYTCNFHWPLSRCLWPLSSCTSILVSSARKLLSYDTSISKTAAANGILKTQKYQFLQLLNNSYGQLFHRSRLYFLFSFLF